MIRSLTCIVALLVLVSSASAQSQAPHTILRPVTSTVRDAGVYHLGLGTWTRRVDTANGITHDIIYANTCPTGYYSGLLTNEYFTDEGRVPGPNGPVNCSTTDGRSTNNSCECSHNVCGFQIGYCSGINGPGAGGGPGPVNVNIGFQDAYTVCAVPSHLPGSPGTFNVTGLPGAGLAPSVQGCWLVTVDLDATSLSFPLAADGASCTWLPSGDSGANHLFGWTFQNKTAVTGVGQSYVGPLTAGFGGPAAPTPICSMVDGLRWDTLTCTGQVGGNAKWPNNLTEDGWGMDTQDRFRDDTTNFTGGPISAPGGAGCYFFGGSFSASFHLRLFSVTGTTCCDHCSPMYICRPFVAGGPVLDGWTCPCSAPPANQPTTPGAGCNALNPGGTPTGGALLTPTGVASLSMDSVHIHVVGLPTSPNESAYLLSGTTSINPQSFGQGLRCCAGMLKRLQIHTNVPSSTTWPAAGDFSPTIHGREAQLGDTILPGQTRCYFIQYRATNIITGCVFPANFNASQAVEITWGN